LPERTSAVCPYVEASDPRCAHQWRPENIIRAFARCADRYFDCPVYRRLADDRQAHEQVRPAVASA
jgi:hypothetical protein